MCWDLVSWFNCTGCVILPPVPLIELGSFVGVVVVGVVTVVVIDVVVGVVAAGVVVVGAVVGFAVVTGFAPTFLFKRTNPDIVVVM